MRLGGVEWQTIKNRILNAAKLLNYWLASSALSLTQWLLPRTLGWRCRAKDLCAKDQGPTIQIKQNMKNVADFNSFKRKGDAA